MLISGMSVISKYLKNTRLGIEKKADLQVIKIWFFVIIFKIPDLS